MPVASVNLWTRLNLPGVGRGASVLGVASDGRSVAMAAAASSKGKEAAVAPLSKPVIFATSGLGGIVGWILVHPFNTLAVRMNLASMSGKAPKSFGAFSTELIGKEGVGSLYAGLGAGCLRQVFYATSRLGLFETFRDMAVKYREVSHKSLSLYASPVCGWCGLL